MSNHSITLLSPMKSSPTWAKDSNLNMITRDKQVTSGCFWVHNRVRTHAGLCMSPKQDEGVMCKGLCGVRKQKINNEFFYHNHNCLLLNSRSINNHPEF